MCECACKRQRSTRNFSSCTPNITITPIGPQRIGLVWSPHWDVKTQSLYMADISAGLINSTVGQPPFYRYDYAENRLYSVTVEGGIVDPSFFLPMAGCKNEFAASNDKRVVVLYWDRVSPSATLVRNMTAVEQNSIYANNHFGTGNVDPKGRLVAGTYREDTCVWTSEANGTLYLFRKDGEIKPLIHNLGTLGGLAWNKKKNLFYFLDSCTYTLFEYKYCPRSGKIRKQMTKKYCLVATKHTIFLLFDFSSNIGDPRSVYTFPVDHSYIAVSMDISCTGNIFAGKYNGSEVVEIDPRYVKYQ